MNTITLHVTIRQPSRMMRADRAGRIDGAGHMAEQQRDASRLNLHHPGALNIRQRRNVYPTH
jgi:hypothetical protein